MEQVRSKGVSMQDLVNRLQSAQEITNQILVRL
jgi:hypothetical protein